MSTYTEQSDHPVPVVDVIVLNERDDVLLIHRTIPPFIGSWEIVGGHIDVEDDNAESAAVREIQEETGLSAEITHLLCISSDTGPRASVDSRFFFVQIAYVARVRGGSLRPNPETDRFRFCSLGDALSESLAFNHHDLLAQYAENRHRMIPVARSMYAEHFGKDFPYLEREYARFAAIAIIQNDRKEILLARRAQKPFQGMWDLPGGHMKVGESPEQTLAREVKEELGVACVVGDLFQVYSDKGHNPKYADVVAYYWTKIESDQFVPNVEMDDFGYFSFDRLPPLAFHADIPLRDIARRF